MVAELDTTFTREELAEVEIERMKRVRYMIRHQERVTWEDTMINVEFDDFLCTSCELHFFPYRSSSGENPILLQSRCTRAMQRPVE